MTSADKMYCYCTDIVDYWLVGPRFQEGNSLVTGRDGHTHWVMDIQPDPIQMFRIILGSSWVELNRVGYGYYPNPTRIFFKKKPLNLSHRVRKF